MLNRMKLDLEKANRRIVVLETLICPDGHAWIDDMDQKGRPVRRCTRCYKSVAGDMPADEKK